MNNVVRSKIFSASTVSFSGVELQKELIESLKYQSLDGLKFETARVNTRPVPTLEGVAAAMTSYSARILNTDLVVGARLEAQKENPDPNVDGHFGLALDAETIEDIFNHLKGMYLSPDTDIWLFCYRLTGKGKPEKLLVINWIGGDKSLAFFINKLGLNKLYWKKISAFFNLSGKEIKESTLKSIHSRLFKPDGELDSDDKNTLQLKNILEKIIG